MILREWSDGSATSWSYYIDVSEQGKGDGRAAAALAVRLLKAAFPNEAVKLSTEQINRKAQRLYEGLGFVRSEEMDGDDLVFVHL